ncbi:MAG: hypothetical protein KC589_03660 [Nanoarchaeota archaeon]|nr:hypothetical protein [Nanoarchaeota archaeon]MCA9496016.1 hypothetical protein [Nanoarchaeota archaeon]
MKVVSEKENKLLNRKDIIAHFDGLSETLSRVQVKAELVKKLKADEKLVIVDEIKIQFGSRDLDVTAYVYDNEVAMKKATSEHILKRNAPPKAEEEAEA